ncbi:MAG: Stp1/IreP family PP2C-type Ser/Thr phosphatase [Bacteroidetes bacterium]|nr:Stp1/IreP family PP2C-type Ser/Thr phosphatase [Bacteroidota bacterium]
MELQLNIGNFSDVGKTRDINEDYFGSFSGSFGSLLLVCDGMGGHKGGEIASRLAVETISNYFEKLNDNYNISEVINKSLEAANTSIILKAKENSDLTDMGSTVVLVLIKDELVYYTSLGDSRIYKIRDGAIQQITKDNSLVQQMVDSNIITKDEAKVHPKKNVITKALGTNDELEPEIYEPFKLQVNDKLILCSDGLTAHVDEEEIFQLSEKNPPQEAAQKLVELANERGGTDNITVQIVAVAVKENSVKQSNSNKYLSYLILLISLIALVFILIKFEVISFGEEPRKANTTGNDSTYGLQSNDEINPATNNKTKDSVNHSSVNKDSLIINNVEAQNNEQNNNQ